MRLNPHLARAMRVVGCAYTICVFSLCASAQDEDTPTSPSPGEYIDNAQIRNAIRFRYDAGFDLNRPDRAEYFYATWAGTGDHPHAIKDTNKLVNTHNTRGPILIPQSVDFQEVSVNLEVAVGDNTSVFAELPVRFVSFRGDLLDDTAFNTPAFNAQYKVEENFTHKNGVSDFQFGFKYAIWNSPGEILTIQLRTFIPTGDPGRGLGTGHVSIEPALLYLGRLTNDVSIFAQAKLWTPLGNTPTAGNIAIYGLGVSHTGYQQYDFRIAPVAEFVGWTVLDGYESLSSPTGAAIVPNTAVVGSDGTTQDQAGNFKPVGVGPAPTSHGVQSAAGHTIVNAKLGVRTYFNSGSNIYVGWGRSLTGNWWYRDLLRLDYTVPF